MILSEFEEEARTIDTESLILPLEYTKLLVGDNFETSEILI